MPYSSFTDDELQAAADRALARAHNAPKCLSGPDEAPTFSGDAWSRFSREWMDMRMELLRRALARGLQASERRSHGNEATS